MSLFAVLVILAMVLWALAFVVSGLVLGVRLLRRPTDAKGLTPAPALKKVGLVLLMGVLGVVFTTALLTAALITERETSVIGGAAARIEARVELLYEACRERFERLWERAGGPSRSDALPGRDWQAALPQCRIAV